MMDEMNVTAPIGGRLFRSEELSRTNGRLRHVHAPHFFLVHDVLWWNRATRAFEIVLCAGASFCAHDLYTMMHEQCLPPGTEFVHRRTGVVFRLDVVKHKKGYREMWLDIKTDKPIDIYGMERRK